MSQNTSKKTTGLSNLSDLFDNISDGVVYHDASGTIYRCNEAACSILGLTRDQLVGRTPVDPRWKAVKHDMSPYPGSEHPAMEALQTGQPVLGKIMGVFLPEENSYRWISINATPRFKRGDPKPWLVLAIFRDITSQFTNYTTLRNSHDRFTSYINYLDEGVWFRDQHHKLIFVNDALARLFGIDKQAFFDDDAEWYMEFVHPDDRALVRNSKLVHMEQQKTVELEWRLIRADGALRWVRVRLQYLHIPGREHELVSSGIMTDITDEKTRDEAVRKAKAEADELSAIKSNIIAKFSHEFRTPITGIMGFVTLLQEQLKDPDLLEFASMIQTSATRLHNTLESILSYAILEAGTYEIRLGEVDLHRVLQPKIDEITTLCTDKGLYFQVTFPESTRVHTDRTLITSIVGELLDNALKFTKQGGIRLALTRVENRLSIEVHDTGIGITNLHKAFVFQPFRQVSEGFVRMFDGAGMGLATLSKQVSLLNGVVNCTHNEHGGTCFIVSIPLAEYDS